MTAGNWGILQGSLDALAGELPLLPLCTGVGWRFRSSQRLDVILQRSFFL